MLTIRIQDKIFQRYITHEEIQQRVQEISMELSSKFHDKNPIFIIILRGAFMFAGDILKYFNDPCEIEFTHLSSYTGMESSGKILIKLPVNEAKIQDRDIIILEDIVDSGLTMDFFTTYLKQLHPKSITLVSFLYKPENLIKEVNIDHIGFTIPELFVVGYGLDYDGQGRNLKDVFQLAV
ncbi:MAG TPA: hypoxanthine phosphoribosyltransferase [Chitinophagales bacterium]|nr:hypoxanthine phosphoribosyltransferase [Chitinophagales bacterium]